MNLLSMNFAFGERLVRAVSLNPLIVVATDVGKAIGIRQIVSTLRGFPDDEKGVHTVSTLGGPQKVQTLTEAGLYRIIFTSRVPNAELFKRWVFNEVLPEIRRTGAYSRKPATPKALPKPPPSPAQIVDVIRAAGGRVSGGINAPRGLVHLVRHAYQVSRNAAVDGIEAALEAGAITNKPPIWSNRKVYRVATGN